MVSDSRHLFKWLKYRISKQSMSRLNLLRTATIPRFLMAGAINTGLTYLLYLGLLLLVPYIWAYSLTYAAGIALGYILNARWVFKKAPTLQNAIIYPIIYGINYLMSISLLWLLVEWVHIPSEIAPLIVLLISVPTMYWMTRNVFKGE